MAKNILQSRLQISSFFILLGLLCLVAFFMLRAYIAPVILALICALPFVRLHRHLITHKIPKNISVGLLFTLFLLILSITGYIFFRILSYQVISLVPQAQEFAQSDFFSETSQQIEATLNRLPGVEIDITQESMVATAQSQSGNLASATSSFLARNISTGALLLTQLTVFLIFFCIFIIHIPNIKQYIIANAPIKPSITKKYISNLLAVIKEVLVGSMLVASIQAVLIFILFSILNIPAPGLFALITVVIGLIPFLGPSFFMVPIAFLFVLLGDFGTSLIILGYQLIVLSNIDILTRPLVARDGKSLHPALMLLAIFGGLTAFGPIGLLFGPLIMSLVSTTVTVFNKQGVLATIRQSS